MFPFFLLFIACIFPISESVLDGNLPKLNAYINKQINYPDFQENFETTKVLLQQIHDLSAYKNVFMKLNNSALQPLTDCLKNISNCSIDEAITLLDSLESLLRIFLTNIMKIGAQCGADLSFHWTSVTKILFSGEVELQCLQDKTLPACNPNGTVIAAVNSLLKENLWALIRKKNS